MNIKGKLAVLEARWRELTEPLWCRKRHAEIVSTLRDTSREVERLRKRLAKEQREREDRHFDKTAALASKPEREAEAVALLRAWVEHRSSRYADTRAFLSRLDAAAKDGGAQ